ncbi:hypothetical protein QUA50_26720, partial [Microcoleus sp. M2_D5]
SRPSPIDGRDAHPTNLWKLFNTHSLKPAAVNILLPVQKNSQKYILKCKESEVRSPLGKKPSV